ncbi:hypothetical protein ACSV5M_19220 [Cellvibrio sp. ARAG 10.3]|uniref:hypothetical protein n=1 Tax=Cellvibrio sp. ARAG 10.3 TaxID=3451358 RepID=UPI003F4465EE
MTRRIIFLAFIYFIGLGISGCAHNSQYAKSCYTNEPRNLCVTSEFDHSTCKREAAIIDSCSAFLDSQVKQKWFQQERREYEENKSIEQKRIEYEGSLQNKFIFGFDGTRAFYFDPTSPASFILSTEKAEKIVEKDLNNLKDVQKIYISQINQGTIDPGEKVQINKLIHQLSGYRIKLIEAINSGKIYAPVQVNIRSEPQKLAHYEQLTFQIVNKTNPKDAYLLAAANKKIEEKRKNGVDYAHITTVGDNTERESINNYGELFRISNPDHDIAWANETLNLLLSKIGEDLKGAFEKKEKQALLELKNRRSDAVASRPSSGLTAKSSTRNTGSFIKFQTPACKTDDLLGEFGRYIIDGDGYGMNQLVSNGDCIVLRAGDAISVIKRGFINATIRYEGYKLFVPVESVSD